MQVIATRDRLNDYLGRKCERNVGLVPTMGALHEGHISLVRRAKHDSEIVVVTIFVNPTQFNDPADLERYPRNLDEDLMLLEELLGEDDLVFVPSSEEVYAEEPVVIPDLAPLDTIMEGKYRPGHFRGVAMVVDIFFNIVRPERAYFGQKDFQQLAIIKALVLKKGLDVDIISCPIIREEDGLALSSRNILLTPEMRAEAPRIAKTLFRYCNPGEMAPAEIKTKVIAEINEGGLLNTEYFEIVDEFELKPVTDVKDIVAGTRYFGCVAVQAGKIRLIDNMEFCFPV